MENNNNKIKTESRISTLETQMDQVIKVCTNDIPHLKKDIVDIKLGFQVLQTQFKDMRKSVRLIGISVILVIVINIVVNLIT